MSPLTTMLRFLAALALLVLMVTFFYRPLSRALARWSDAGAATDAVSGAATGDETAAAGELGSAVPPSFLLQVFSTPPHGRVRVDGKERGTTPAVTNIPCRNGQIVVVTVDLAGYPRWQRQLPCLPGESAVLQVKLGG